MTTHEELANVTNRLLRLLAFILLPLAMAMGAPKPAYQVLAPITQDNLTIFPVASPTIHDAGKFLTLDEGLSSGQVIVTETGRVHALRGDGERTLPQREYRGDGAEVNRLVLINQSNLPLLLLAGEIVTGGKQDRVVGKDRIVPAHSDPVDLSVFCVEPGRWVANSSAFGGLTAQMAQPSVRRGAMAEQSQTRVWDEVRGSQRAMAAKIAGAPAAAATSSYASVVNAAPVRNEVDRMAQPLERSYERLIKDLRDRKAVGVVVAVNGRVIWADVFSSPSLLEKYWPKLVRSYAAEAVVARAGLKPAQPSPSEAQRFLTETAGAREIVQTEPGLYRATELQGDNDRTFELTALLPGTNYVVHLAKMVTGPATHADSQHTTGVREPAGLERPHVQW